MIWRQWMAQFRPQGRIKFIDRVPHVGILRTIGLGPARLFQLNVPKQAFISRGGPTAAGAPDATISVQLTGTSRCSQGGRTCVLNPGDVTLTDHTRPYSAEGEGSALFFEFPRALASGMLPFLLRQPSQAFPAALPEARLIGDALRSAWNHAGACSSSMRICLVFSLLQLATGLQSADYATGRSGERVLRALEDIEAAMFAGPVRPEDIAHRQAIGRRQLDELFKKHLGTTVADQISERRFSRAVAALCSRPAASITEIALAAGYADSAHFAKVFRRRLGVSPSAWRAKLAPQAAELH